MRKLKLIVTIICICIFCTGCWDSVPINKRILPLMGGYDLPQGDKTGNNITATAIYSVPKGEKERAMAVESITSNSISDTRQIRAASSIRYWSPSILQGMIYSKALAQNGLWPVLDVVIRSPQMRGAVNMCIVDTSAKELLEQVADSEIYDETQFANILEGGREPSFMLPNDTLYFQTCYYTPGANPVLPIIKSDDDKHLVLGGIAIFRKDKMIDTMSLESAKYLAILSKPQTLGNITFEATLSDGTKVMAVANCIISRTVVPTRRDNTVDFLVKLNVRGGIIEIGNKWPVALNEQDIECLQTAMQQHLQLNCGSIIQLVNNKYEMDCINLSSDALAIWRKDIKDSICTNEFWRESKISTECKVRFTKTGERA